MLSWIDKIRLESPVVQPLELPERFMDAEFRRIPNGELKTVVREYCSNFYDEAAKGIGCLFIGRAEQYKTYAACVVAKQIHKHAKVDVVFIQCTNSFNDWERNRFTDGTARAITMVEEASVVIMDDFSMIAPNSYGAGILAEIAETRFSNLRPTIWTGNVAGTDILNSLAGLYGPGVARRIWSGTEGYRVRV